MAEKTPRVELELQFNEIVEEYGRFLQKTIAQLCPRDLGIQFGDIEQEARLRLWRALEAEREIRDLASYIYRIAATTTVDAIRRAKARREEQLRLVDDEAEEKAINLPAGSESSPELAAEHRLLEQQVQGVLSRMPDDRRRAVALYLEGMTTHEIADICGWTEPKARNLAYRGLKVLRKDLRDMGIKC